MKGICGRDCVNYNEEMYYEPRLDRQRNIFWQAILEKNT